MNELDLNQVYPKLVDKNVFTEDEQREITLVGDRDKSKEVMISILSGKNEIKTFREFCTVLETTNPKLLTSFLLETAG